MRSTYRPIITRLPMIGISFVLILVLMRTERRKRARLDVSDPIWTFSSSTGGDIRVKFLAVIGRCQASWHVLKVEDVSTGNVGYCVLASTVVESSLLEWRGAAADPEVSVPAGPYEVVSHYSPFSLDEGVYHLFPESKLHILAPTS